MSKWFRMEVNKDDPTVADLFIFGFIGDWVDDLWSDIGFGFDSVTTAKSFQKELDALPENVTKIREHVNSPGGDVFGAVAIANMLRDQRITKGRTVEVTVEGLAASAASIVIQAGDPIRISDNGLIMIHDPWTRAVGNSRELRQAADELDKISESSIIGTYRWNSKLDAKEIAKLMAATTWMDADEAVANGFATEKVTGLKAAASIDPKSIRGIAIPEKYKARVAAFLATEDPGKKEAQTDLPPGKIVVHEAADPSQVIRLCRESSCLGLAEELVGSGASLEQVQDSIAKEREAMATAKVRADQIRALCDTAKLSELAEDYINGQMATDSIRAHLTLITAKMDKVEIDGSINPDHGTTNIGESWKKAFARAKNRFRMRF